MTNDADTILKTCTAKAETGKVAKTNEFYREWCERDMAGQSFPTPDAKEAAIDKCVAGSANTRYNRHHTANLAHFAGEIKDACISEEVFKTCSGKASAETQRAKGYAQLRWDGFKQRIDAFCSANFPDRKAACVAHNEEKYASRNPATWDETQFPVGAGTFLSCRAKAMDDIRGAQSKSR